jgi:hypothetical protein
MAIESRATNLAARGRLRRGSGDGSRQRNSKLLQEWGEALRALPGQIHNVRPSGNRFTKFGGIGTVL